MVSGTVGLAKQQNLWIIRNSGKAHPCICLKLNYFHSNPSFVIKWSLPYISLINPLSLGCLCWILYLLLINNLVIPSVPSGGSTSDQFEHDCQFLDALCRQEDLSDVFKARIQLYPPDLTKESSKSQEKRQVDVHVNRFSNLVDLWVIQIKRSLESFALHIHTVFPRLSAPVECEIRNKRPPLK